MAAAVGDAHLNLADAELLDHVFDAAADGHHRFAARLVADFDVAPGDAPPPAGAQGLHDRFLGGPAAGEVLRGLLAALTILDLFGRVHAVDEQLAVPLDHPGDPQALRDVGADANEFGHRKQGLGIRKSRWAVTAHSSRLRFRKTDN